MSRPVLRVGDSGDAVAELIDILGAQGFWDRPNTSIFSDSVEDSVEYFQSTHIGEDGEQLTADGVVGPATWWALLNPEGEAQRSFYVVGDIPTNLSANRVALLELALKYHGAKEQPNGSNRGPEVDTFLPGWWLSKNSSKAKGPAWCGYFVGALLKETLGHFPYGGHYGSTHKIWTVAEQKEMTRNNPTPGDIFMLLNSGGTGHTGFVYWVSPDGDSYYTVEGNCGNRVKVGKRSRRASNFKGFINPYGDEPFNYALGDLRVAEVGSHGTR